MKEYKLNVIVNSLRQKGFVTSRGYDIIYDDVKDAVRIMNKKHSKWVDFEVRNIMINLEGYFWLEEVYFNLKHKILDADVIFFEKIVERYIQTCNIENVDYQILPLIEFDMTFNEFAKFVDCKVNTVRKAYYKLPKLKKRKYYYVNKIRYIPVDVLEELCKKYFKLKYLKYLEELYICLKESLNQKGIEMKYE